MGSTLWIYGDSFAEEKVGSWTTILSKNLEMESKIKAVGGACTEYAFKHFTNDLKNKSFKPSDVVIFVMSSPGRLNFYHQLNEDPQTGTQIIRDVNNNKTDNPRNRWYNNNEEHIEWWFANKDYSLDNINHEGYISLIKDAAYNYPDVLFIVLPIVSISYNLDLNKSPSNFLRSYTYLTEISKKEIIGAQEDNNWYKKFISATNNIDVRINHLTDCNIKLLAYALEEVVRKKSIDNFKYTAFRQEIIPYLTSKKDWEDGVEKGFYIYQKFISDILKNI